MDFDQFPVYMWDNRNVVGLAKDPHTCRETSVCKVIGGLYFLP